jgi:crossover junction endodeoxyribonuclease RuvC
MVILGIDPGLNATGYGAIAVEGRLASLITAGDIRPPRGRPLPERLHYLHAALAQILNSQHPDAVVLEMVYTHQSYVNTAALMAHARGVACLATQQQAIPLVEYPPARVKKALTGRGAASKDQVAQMVTQWLGVCDPAWSHDATDALALAIAHAHMVGQPQMTTVRTPRTASHRW